MKRFFSTSFAGIYILVFAVAIGVATFIENDFGTSSAMKLVFQAKWFEVLLILFSITLVVNVVKYKMIPQKRWALVIFHLSMVMILVGAGVTRYFGYEGTMHIREGESSNTILSRASYLNFQATSNGNNYEFSEPVLFSAIGSNAFYEKYNVAGRAVEVEVMDILPNPANILAQSASGQPIVKIVYGGSGSRQEFYIGEGERRTLFGLNFDFSQSLEDSSVVDFSEAPTDFNIYFSDGDLFFKSRTDLSEMVMISQTQSALSANQVHPLKLRSLYDTGDKGFVFGDFLPSGELKLTSTGRKLENSSTIGISLKVTIDDVAFERYIFGRNGGEGRAEVFQVDGMDFSASFGSKRIQLPFSIYLNDFIMDRYPGTQSPASYASEVTLIDDRDQIRGDHRIFMNNVLDHDGFRFFQSSFDPDEKGTYLSVNHDYWGTMITYFSYAFFTLGLVMVFFSKKTRFYILSQKLKTLQDKRFIFLALVCVSSFLSQPAIAQESIKPVLPELYYVDDDHATLFNTVIVQDFKGRMKPMQTLSNELMRKVTGKTKYNGFTASTTVLSMYADAQNWYSAPMIGYGKNEGIADVIGVSLGNLASYKDFFFDDGSYKLSGEIRDATGKNPAERGMYEKQLLKVDERVNIVGMIFAGSFFKVIPIEEDENNTWVGEMSGSQTSEALTSPIAQAFFSTYRRALYDAMQSVESGEFKTGAEIYQLCNQIVLELKQYQTVHGAAVIPSKSRIATEIALNNSNVFNRLALYYFMLGMLFLGLLFYSVFFPEGKAKKFRATLVILVIIGFVFHTSGLGARWYITGRAPWSNGYESMIYIAWTSVLAGLIFTRKSLGAMAATMVLGGAILLIAMLSYLDPEITPLVPVLKSYWLTIHVSLIAGSYGFLMLGAIIGFINLLLYVLLTKKNKSAIVKIIKEMTYISEMTLTGGIVLLSVGTYLGGVWANESWGRYWGWDAKETWALVSILVYAFILHMRLIPGLKSVFAYNFATLFGLSSVIMTYFGVNYYLSGLHSYAAGDPVPIPNWVYYAVAAAAIVSFIAYMQKNKHQIS